MSERQKKRYIFSSAVKKNWPEFLAYNNWDYGRKKMLPCYIEMAYFSGKIPPYAYCIKDPLSAYMVHLVIEGTYSLSSDSADWVLHPGDAVLLEPGISVKEYTSSSECTRILAVTFAGGLVPALLNALHLKVLSVFSGVNLKRIVPLQERIIHLLKEKNENESAKLGSLLFEMLYEIASGRKGVKPDGDLSDLVRVLDSALSAEKPLEMVMERMNITRSELKKMMRCFFHESPLRFLIRRRLERASELLISTDLPVREIASRVGYHPATRFCFCFRKAFGITPMQCRRSGKMPVFLSKKPLKIHSGIRKARRK